MSEKVLKLQQISLPMSLAHACGRGGGLENNCAAVRRVLPFKPQGIEIDVRKAADGTLFGRHGSIPFGVLFWQFAPLFNFRWIKRHFPEINSLDEILELIPDDIMVVLDIKDTRITGKDLLPYKRAHLCILDYDIGHMLEIKNVLGDEEVWYGLAPKFFLRRALKKARGIADVVITFWWQNTPRALEMARQNNILLQPLQFLISRQKYVDRVRNWSGVYIIYDYRNFKSDFK